MDISSEISRTMRQFGIMGLGEEGTPRPTIRKRFPSAAVSNNNLIDYTQSETTFRRHLKAHRSTEDIVIPDGSIE